MAYINSSNFSSRCPGGVRIGGDSGTTRRPRDFLDIAFASGGGGHSWPRCGRSAALEHQTWRNIILWFLATLAVHRTFNRRTRGSHSIATGYELAQNTLHDPFPDVLFCHRRLEVSTCRVGDSGCGKEFNDRFSRTFADVSITIFQCSYQKSKVRSYWEVLVQAAQVN